MRTWAGLASVRAQTIQSQHAIDTMLLGYNDCQGCETRLESLLARPFAWNTNGASLLGFISWSQKLLFARSVAAQHGFDTHECLNAMH